jgi:hypothetical protein
VKSKLKDFFKKPKLSTLKKNHIINHMDKILIKKIFQLSHSPSKLMHSWVLLHCGPHILSIFIA